MYFYIYDNFLTDKKYQIFLSHLETRITDFGMAGKIIRMSVLKNLKSSINDGIRNGVKTIVIVGNDKTLNQALNAIDDLNIAIGFIPVGPNNAIKDLLGIPEGEAAIETLSARLLLNLHFGLINEKYKFLTYLELAGNNAVINCDNDYYVTVNDNNEIITVSNIYYGELDDQLPITNNQEKISVMIRAANSTLFKHKSEKFSFFQANKVNIQCSKPLPILLLDEKIILKTPLNISGSKEMIKIIVGKNRKVFN